MPPAALVASTTVKAPESPCTRRTGAMTPVDVSLCGQAYTSMPSVTTGSLREPAGASMTWGAIRNGAVAAVANF